MASLLIYPHPAATVAIYALAFGDGFSGLVGRIWGRHPIPVLGGKTFIGSFACFFAVFVSALGVLGDPMDAFLVATAATAVEALPLGDIDNLAVPLVSGYVAAVLL
jgi:dolichol kinase